MDNDQLDLAVRQEAFRFLKQCFDVYGEVVPYKVLSQGFQFEGVRVPLIGPQGIFKPRVLPEMPLSITTAPPVPGKPRPYDDKPVEDGILEYRYRGTDPFHRDNVGLRLAGKRRVPLIYLFGLAKGFYRPVWPTYVLRDDPTNLSFHITVDDETLALSTPEDVDIEKAEARRRYITTQTQVRLHQDTFRVNVLRAYRESCAICRLRHPELLEAAHIIPDSDPRGVPEVRNGLSLCAIHHKAFDKHILGIRPDYHVDVRQDILEEIDGPMLKYGLQGFQDKIILLPRRNDEKPDKDSLEEKYEKFRSAG